MTIKEKVEHYKNHNFQTWLKMRNQVFDKLSDMQTMFCVCGKLATGLHEKNCRRFNEKVDKETAKRLEKEELY